MTYNISEAKDNIDLILDLAESGQPQVIKRGNKEVAVIVSVEDWKRMSEHDRGIRSLTEKDAAGMTVNERLYVSGFMDEFDAAVAARDRQRMAEILNQMYLDQETVKSVIRCSLGTE